MTHRVTITVDCDSESAANETGFWLTGVLTMKTATHLRGHILDHDYTVDKVKTDTETTA